MRSDLTKAQRRRLRELGTVAYERDLGEQLAKLEDAFRRWRADAIDAFDLSEEIHRFHQGPSRALFPKYDHANLEFAVADAIHRGVVSADEAGPEVLECLAGHLAFLRERDVAAQPGVTTRGASPRRSTPHTVGWPRT